MLVARDDSGIRSVKDLARKKVATPFVSTAHYQLMAAMQLEGVDVKKVNVMNMRPPEIAAAWERGDIDATFIWDPVLSRINGNGKVIATSGEIGARGYPTFDSVIVNAKWAAQNEAFMVALVKVMAKAQADYRNNLATFRRKNRSRFSRESGPPLVPFCDGSTLSPSLLTGIPDDSPSPTAHGNQVVVDKPTFFVFLNHHER